LPVTLPVKPPVAFTVPLNVAERPVKKALKLAVVPTMAPVERLADDNAPANAAALFERVMMNGVAISVPLSS